MTAEGKAIKEAYQWEAKSQWKDKPTTESLCLAVRFYFKTKHRRDLDNQNKLVLDALSGIVYEDDSQIDELRLYRRFDIEEPRIEVQIEELTL
jgi:crossover junction endodeoxyribonuclease RusA